jgi:hypothetical protein
VIKIKVKIQVEDNGRKAEVEIDESDKLTNLVIIQQVFTLFGINTDVLEMTKTYNSIGKAYASFFNQVEPIEPSKDSLPPPDKNEIKEKLIQGLTESKEELETTYKETSDQPEFVRTGIKEDKDGKKRYRVHYKCVACWNRGTHYIYPDSKRTWCHRCQHELSVHFAHPDSTKENLLPDSFNNYFRAGDFYDWNVFTTSPI